MQTLTIKTNAHSQTVNITQEVQSLVQASKIKQGCCRIFVKHTTCAVCVNEAADSDVMIDMLAGLERMVPWQASYRHAEGNSAAT